MYTLHLSGRALIRHFLYKVEKFSSLCHRINPLSFGVELSPSLLLLFIHCYYYFLYFINYYLLIIPTETILVIYWKKFLKHFCEIFLQIFFLWVISKIVRKICFAGFLRNLRRNFSSRELPAKNFVSAKFLQERNFSLKYFF